MKDRATLTFVRWVVRCTLLLSIGNGAIIGSGDRVGSRELLALTATHGTNSESSIQQQGHQPVLDGEREVNKSPKTPEELLEMIRTLKDSGVSFEGQVPEEGPLLEAYSNLVYQRLANGEGGISGSLAAGNLHIHVVRDPKQWDYRTNEIDHYRDDFNGLEWIALFKDVLKCPMGTEITTTNHAILSDERPYQLKFVEALPDYPMLARMWNTFEDVIYESKEIPKLRDECLRVSSITANQQALFGLNKLLQACDEAIANQAGIYMSCD